MSNLKKLKSRDLHILLSQVKQEENKADAEGSALYAIKLNLLHKQIDDILEDRKAYAIAKLEDRKAYAIAKAKLQVHNPVVKEALIRASARST